MINNPAKRLDDIEIEIKELNQEANAIKDFYRGLSKGRAEMFPFDWTKNIMVHAQKKAPKITVREEIDSTLLTALTRKISKQMYNKCYKSGAIPKQMVRLIGA